MSKVTEVLTVYMFENGKRLEKDASLKSFSPDTVESPKNLKNANAGTESGSLPETSLPPGSASRGDAASRGLLVRVPLNSYAHHTWLVRRRQFLPKCYSVCVTTWHSTLSQRAGSTATIMLPLNFPGQLHLTSFQATGRGPMSETLLVGTNSRSSPRSPTQDLHFSDGLQPDLAAGTARSVPI